MISAAQLRRSFLSPTIRCLHGRVSTSPSLLQQSFSFRKLPKRTRGLSTTKLTSSSASSVASTPPLLVRTALVATTTAVGTPTFPVVGVVNFGLRYVVWDRETRLILLGSTTLVGGVVALVNFAALDLLPVAYSYASLFLPFAVVNGGLSGMAYLALDAVCGTTALAQIKWTGAAIGAYVGLVGPLSGLYDHAFQWFYELPDFDGWVNQALGNRFMLPITVATGAMVGLAIHPLLYFPIVGIPGVHWAKFSAPVLGVATLLTAHLYMADYFNSSLFPPETYLTEEEKKHLLLIPRLHSKRLQVEDWAADVGYRPDGTGKKAREAVAGKLEAAKTNGHGTDLVFESKRKAWFHYVTHGTIGGDYVVGPDHIPSKLELSQKAQQYFFTDGAVAFVMIQGMQPNNDATSVVREKVISLALNLQARKQPRKQEAVRTAGRIELASYGITILMTLKQEEKGLANAMEVKWLEKAVRKLVPGIILYKREEEEDTEECSVEAQLNAFGWKGIKDEEAKKHVAKVWKSGLQRIQSARESEARARQLTLAMTTLGAILLLGLSGGGQG